MRALDIAATGMQAQQTNVEVISNNIANMTTTGYKRRRAEFKDLIYQNLRRVGSNSSDTGQVLPSGAQIGLGVKTVAVVPINEQGNLQQSGNSLDVAISGNGYFQVALPSGEVAYTRDGSFALSPTGQIVTSRRLCGAAHHHHPAGRHLGHHQPRRAGAGDARRPDRAATGRAAAARHLPQSGRAAGAGRQSVPGHRRVRQRRPPACRRRRGSATCSRASSRTSNVNVVSEITDLITAQRAYEMNSKVITAGDQMMSTLTNLH